MLNTVKYDEQEYLKFQEEGYAAEFAIPYAKKVCVGIGYDIGPKKEEWAYPGSIPIDIDFDDIYHATNLPSKNVDYIFSSHCLEHIDNWIYTIEYWLSCLKPGGILFMYLPDFSQYYWRPWNNRKHKHVFTPEIIKEFFKDNQKNCRVNKIFISGIDLNNSFMVVVEK
jgi:predicted SAM-dependent methyltransferase